MQRQGRMRVRALFFLPSLIAFLLAAILHLSGAFQIFDGIIFDKISVRTAGGAPVVTIVERGSENAAADLARAGLELGADRVVFLSDPADDFAALSGNQRERVAIGYTLPSIDGELPGELIKAQTGDAGQVAYLPLSDPAPEYGIYRKRIAWRETTSGQVAMLETAVAESDLDAGSYYVPMPRSLSFAVLSAEQLLSADLGAGDLKGLIVLVATPEELRENLLVTPLDPDRASVSRAHFSAYAIQSLKTGTAVREAGTLVSLLLIAISAMFAGLATILIRRRLIALLITAAWCFAIAVIGWFAFQAAATFQPFGGMWVAAVLAALGTILLQERRKDQTLEATLVRSIEQTVSHSAFRNRDNLPALLAASASTIGIERMLLVRADDPLSPEPEARLRAEPSELPSSARADLARLASGLSEEQSRAAPELLPDWPGDVRLRAVGSHDEPLYWLYTFGDRSESETSEPVARNLAKSFLAMQRAHASLSAQHRGIRAVDPVDFRVVDAMGLVSRHGRQLRQAANQLHSAVMFFDIVGFPLHSNSQMVDLVEASGLNPQTALLPEIIEALTDFSREQAEALIRGVLRDGGEATAPISHIPGVNATLRLSSPDPAFSGSESVVVLEAFDTSDLARLADLRLAISQFVDVQMRNDLETIALGAALARKSGAKEERRLRMIDKIVQASETATRRLDAMNDLAGNMAGTAEFSAHPIQIRPIVERVEAQLSDFFQHYDVSLALELPEISGYTVADPVVLAEMIEALLRLVVVDSPPGGVVTLSLVEEEQRSQLRIKGGFGMTRERVAQALEAPPRKEIPEFQTVKEGALAISRWGGEFRFESDTGKGYDFQMKLRRIV